MKYFFLALVNIILFSFTLTSQVNGIKPKTSTAPKVYTGPTQKELFDKFFALNDGDTAEVAEKFRLSELITSLDSTSKYYSYIISWYGILGKYYEQIEPIVKKLPVNYPDFAEGYFLYGQFLNYSDQEGGIEQIQKCIELNPKLSQPYFILATLYEKAKNYKLALTYYNLLEQTNPKHKSLYYNRAEVKNELKDYNGAISDYSKVIQNKPDHYRAIFNRGIVYIAVENYINAEKDFNTFIKEISNYGYAYYYRGYAEYSLNKLQAACDDMRIASNLGADDADEFVKNYCK